MNSLFYKLKKKILNIGWAVTGCEELAFLSENELKMTWTGKIRGVFMSVSVFWRFEFLYSSFQFVEEG